MDLEKLLDTVYRLYKDDLKIEDSPPTVGNISFKEGDIVELKGNIYVYLWKKTDYGYLGLLATPYTLLAHPSHPRVKTDNPLYEVMAITDIYIPLKEETIRKYITDKIEVLEDKQALEKKIKVSRERKKIYHPIREKFLREEARRTTFLIMEFLENEEKEEQEEETIIIKIPQKVLEKVEKPLRKAAETEQETAENENFLIIKQTENSYSLILKNYSLFGKRVKILLNNEPIYEDILDTNTIIVGVEGEISPTLLADLLKVEE